MKKNCLVLVILLLAACAGTNNKNTDTVHPEITENTILPLHADLRGDVIRIYGIDLDEYDLMNSDLDKITFDSFTVWPKKSKLPETFDPDILIETGKNPGLGINTLHQNGIVGKNINVAIIDQPLLVNHVEFKEKIKFYKEIETDNAGPQHHGPAVASILFGEPFGVAPGVNLYYWAQPDWKLDHKYRIQALREIIDFNAGKSLAEQIRIVSISKGFGRDEPNLEQWKNIINEAERAGIVIVHCSSHIAGAQPPLYGDRDNSELYSICYFLSETNFFVEDFLLAPIDNRTYASHMGNEAFTFQSYGGLSWAAPYIAGVAALGLQIKPDLTTNEIWTLLRDTGTDFHGGKLINPMGFIDKISAMTT